MSSKPHVLIIAGEEPRDESVYGPLPPLLRSRGADVSIVPFFDPSLDLKKYTAITFLYAWGYHRDIERFTNFVKAIPSSSLPPILNGPAVVLWNIDKAEYLEDLRRADFTVPETKYITLPANLNDDEPFRKTLASLDGSKPVVLKPSISASGHLTCLVRTPHAIQMNEDLHDLLSGDKTGPARLMFQEFIPEIASGEYSIMFVSGSITHVVLKVAGRENEFRVQSRHGGKDPVELALDDVPKIAISEANRIWKYLETKFGDELLYARIDGIVRVREGRDEFAIIEVELMEPTLFLQQDSKGTAVSRVADRLLVAGL